MTTVKKRFVNGWPFTIPKQSRCLNGTHNEIFFTILTAWVPLIRCGNGRCPLWNDLWHSLNHRNAYMQDGRVESFWLALLMCSLPLPDPESPPTSSTHCLSKPSLRVAQRQRFWATKDIPSRFAPLSTTKWCMP